MPRALRNLVTALTLAVASGALVLAAPAPAHAQSRGPSGSPGSSGPSGSPAPAGAPASGAASAGGASAGGSAGAGGAGGSAGASPGTISGAEPTNEPKTKEQLEAQQHFQRAKELYSAGSYREAIAELEAAHALDPRAKDLVFNLGIVAERLGKYDEAIAYFQKYMQMDGVTAGERAKAENVIKRIDGAKREAAAAKPTRAPGSGDTDGASDRGARPAPKPARGRVDAATIAVGSVGAVALVGGAVFGVLALSSKPGDDFVTGRDGSYADLQQKTDDAHTQAIVADIGIGVGIVALAVTAYLYFGRTREPGKTALSLSPATHGAGRGALLGGTF